ncbi:glutamate--cysteine ligase [Nocardia bovistercoris]|uniref:Putative glutamate--cysteine ligase 2 n=1 Tax=Nocardia bovistercoris TaxID=2785916 RepID=A0A931IB77_9NOCA|nr:glutamate--cysteine ligase [Nocardia bovistercoris]MBH0777836.1 glutamate--cysteine ligase [Nocardia bovistercoris]
MGAAVITVGVEEEFLLVDPCSGAPAAKNLEVAAAARRAGVSLQLEMTCAQVETSTRVHTETAALHEELRTLRRTVADCAVDNGARLLAVAIPPTVSHRLPITAIPRYQRIARTFGLLADEQGLCGCHVHVGVPDRETAVLVGNYVRPWLPVLLAMTANSAIYRGEETGYASWRSILWRRWPSAGPPPYFTSLDEYEAMVAMMRVGGSILDNKMVYWDIRPSESFPTVEIRVSDVPATAEEAALLAALIRAAVTTGLRWMAEGVPAPAVPAEVLRAAYWNAAHAGLDGPGLDPVHGRIVPHREILSRLVETVSPALREAGDLDFVLDAIASLHVRGNGARRQVATMRARSEIGDVVEELTRATVEKC